MGIILHQEYTILRNPEFGEIHEEKPCLNQIQSYPAKSTHKYHLNIKLRRILHTKIIVPPPPSIRTTHHPQTSKSRRDTLRHPISNRLSSAETSCKIASARRPDPGANDPTLWLRCDGGSISASPFSSNREADWRGSGSNTHVWALT
jgi:hypothetical protein